MSGKKILGILILVILTFTLVGCDIFNDDTVGTEKTGEGVLIAEVKSLDELYVDPGTTESDVIAKLEEDRNTVDLVLSNGNEVAAKIAWEGANGNYNSEVLDVPYEFEGTALYNDLSTDISIEVVVDDRFGLTLEIKGEGEIEILNKEDNSILSVTDNKKEIRYEPGSELQVNVVPIRNWVFMGWKGEKDTTQSTVEITMDGHKELQAVFGNIKIDVLEDEYKKWEYWYLSGKLENLIGSKIESVEIYVEIYDVEDKLITSKNDVIENIADGETTDWKVGEKFIDFENSSYYKIILRNLQLAE